MSSHMSLTTPQPLPIITREWRLVAIHLIRLIHTGFQFKEVETPSTRKLNSPANERMGLRLVSLNLVDGMDSNLTIPNYNMKIVYKNMMIQ